ncbi:MAG: family 20 glycosylhydrolase [Gemmatimonadales bacterium]|nr:family 20 glycosylhydrolase [Gemmatimonadales bacterium]
MARTRSLWSGVAGVTLVSVGMGCTAASSESADPMKPHALMPVPTELSFHEGSLSIDSSFMVALSGRPDPRLDRAAARLIERLAKQTGIRFLAGVGGTPADATLEIQVEGTAGAIPQVVEDESYSLEVSRDKALLSAATPFGALRGIETFLQLVEMGVDGATVRSATIRDAPRFPWRGLLIDVSRHWMPVEVIKRNLDAMAAVKLNVLHWHLSEDQGFRVESTRFPKLHELGSDGWFYTQDQIRDVVAYAADRGIRVVPEFDIPGHTTSWFVGHPELASAPGPYQIERHFGVFHPTMDPSKEEVYDFLDRFIGEIAPLFPDPFWHIGGDEVTGRQWERSRHIQDFMRRNGLEDNHELQAHFNRRLYDILAKHGKQMVGWEEIRAPGFPQDIVVQSWRGEESLAEAVSLGYDVILSRGYYLDLIQPAGLHYGVDPLGTAAASLPPEQQARVLGGEACMWAEFVTAENVDSRIWPRAAAIAERFWSPRTVTDVDDMYRRLEAVSVWLESVGVTHRTSYPIMLQRLTGDAPFEPLQVLANVVEPIKEYRRHRNRDYTSATPLVRLVDAARPESDVARHFNRAVDEFLADSSHVTRRDEIHDWLVGWRDHYERLAPIIERSPALGEIGPLSRTLAELGEIGLQALAEIEGTGGAMPVAHPEWPDLLERASQPVAELDLMVVQGVRMLVAAAVSRQ